VSPKLPAVSGKDTARVAEHLGFELRRQRGSHAIYVRRTDKARVVIPMHGKAALKPKTLRGIIQDMQISVEQFHDLI